MSLETFLVGRLDPIFGQRLYRQRLPPEAVLPAGTYQRVDTVHGYAHGGDDHLPQARVQVDCWAADPDSADSLAMAVKGSLSGYSDAIYQRVEIADDRELDEPDVGIYRRSVDLLLAYQEDLP